MNSSVVYPTFQPKGEKFRKWIESSNEPGCPVVRSTFDLNSRVTNPGRFTRYDVPHKLTREWNTEMENLGLLTESLELLERESQYRYVEILNNQGPQLHWSGRIGPGVIMVDNILRIGHPKVPHISDFTKAAYELNFPISGLKHVFVTNIVNPITTRCVSDEVYKSIVPYKYPSSENRNWDYATAEYDALLATPIGKMVACFVLCTYGQGEKRIARIVTFNGNRMQELNMRFDIE